MVVWKKTSKGSLDEPLSALTELGYFQLHFYLFIETKLLALCFVCHQFIRELAWVASWHTEQ